MFSADIIQPLKKRVPFPLIQVKSKEPTPGSDDDPTPSGSTYLEEDVTVIEFARSLVPTRKSTAKYFVNLFPCIDWLPRYNWRWLVGDLISGLTVGLVVVPQAMAYALLANLTPEFGLYTSFAGAAIYWLLGTSKDIVIGTTAVGSLLVGEVIAQVEQSHPDVYTRANIARTLSFMIGVIMLPVGFLRLGWIVDVIPYIPISAFVTSASITIMTTQFPVMMGITGLNTRDSPYKVIIESLKALPRTQLDAAIGLSCLVLLTIIRSVCAKLEVRQPSQQRFWAMVSALRLTFAMLLYTLISWLVHRDLPDDERKFRIVGSIPRGFQYTGVPQLDQELIVSILPRIPVVIIILVIEHIAIAKSFGKRFNYTVIPSQEIMAQSAANMLGPFLGGYNCTGSFGASAVVSKAGVRTPLAGMFSAMILILALYTLTTVFYYIPNAALAGLIIHATMNLIASPRTLRRYWRLSPLEFFIWLVGVLMAVFAHLETSIYTTIGLSMALLLIRVARTKVLLLGQVTVWQRNMNQKSETPPPAVGGTSPRDCLVPMDSKDPHNPSLVIQSPYPGIFVYRFAEGLNFLNQAQQLSCLGKNIRNNTCSGKRQDNVPKHDILWSDKPIASKDTCSEAKKPILRGVVFDCASINNIDITSIEGLVDLRNNLERHAQPHVVDWHFASVTNRWTRRALAVAGFGVPSNTNRAKLGNWSAVYAVASTLAGASAEDARAEADKRRSTQLDNDREGKMQCSLKSESSETEKQVGDGTQSVWASSLRPIYGVNRPFFHLDLTQAVSVAVRIAKEEDQRGGSES